MIETSEKTKTTKKIEASKLSFEQRKELIGLMKRMLPPVPSKGIVDIRFSFWFIRRWYFIGIFGKDTRNEFKALDKGYLDNGLTALAKFFAYTLILLTMLIVILFMLYLIKSYLGINFFQDHHLIDVIRDIFKG